METHTLARYFSEHSLQEYDFVMEKPSYVAAASMYLALRMKKLGGWVGQTWYNVVLFDLHPFSLSLPLFLSLSLSLQTPTLQHYSGYTVEEMLPMVKRLSSLIQKPLGQTCTVRSKYSHE
jgi:cyclin B